MTFFVWFALLAYLLLVLVIKLKAKLIIYRVQKHFAGSCCASFPVKILMFVQRGV